jgi:hypothetical protein
MAHYRTPPCRTGANGEPAAVQNLMTRSDGSTGADGSMLLHATGHPVGSEYDFIFTLTH